jgi:hypothetical protein
MLRENEILSINVQVVKMHGGSQSIDHWGSCVVSGVLRALRRNSVEDISAWNSDADR